MSCFPHAHKGFLWVRQFSPQNMHGKLIGNIKLSLCVSERVNLFVTMWPADELVTSPAFFMVA